MFDWLYSLVSPDLTTNLTLKWIAVDVAYCLVLKRLRIPRLNYAGVAVLLQIFSMCMIDGILFGTVRVSSITFIFRVHCTGLTFVCSEQIGVSSYSLSSTARDFCMSFVFHPGFLKITHENSSYCRSKRALDVWPNG